MGTFIILSGSSSVGKGPLVETMDLYFKSIGVRFMKHVLYNSRAPRPEEKNGETYHFLNKNEQDAIAVKNLKCQRFNVNSDQQMINFEMLEKELDMYDVVLLEISIFEVPTVMRFCNQYKIQAKQIFVSPLSKDDFELIGGGFTNEHDREIAIKAVMLTKLANRGTETTAKQIVRFSKASKEMQTAINMKSEIFCNHFGEDNKHLWNLLQEYVSKPGSLEIAKTFIEFVKLINDEKHLNHIPQELDDQSLAKEETVKAEEKLEKAEKGFTCPVSCYCYDCNYDSCSDCRKNEIENGCGAHACPKV